MRETYIPLFQDIRQSSLWAYDSDIRIVWITLLTLVDPEGFICAAAPGLAIAANVPLGKVREALALFEAPDFDSRSTDKEGRRLEKVPRGWHMVSYKEHRERARRQAELARKRRWMNAHRAQERNSSYDVSEDEDVDAPVASVEARGETVGASESKSKSKSKSLPSEGEGIRIPPTPHEPKGSPGGSPATWHTLGDWVMSAELRAEAVIAGVHPDEIDKRVEALRNIPIGGNGGVINRDVYVRAQFGKWKTWGETDRAQALAPRSGPRRTGGPLWEPTAKQVAYAAHHGLPLAHLVGEYHRSGEPVDRGGGRDADDAFTARLNAAAKKKKGGGRHAAA